MSATRDNSSIYEYYWLRPENGLWRARDFQVLSDVVFEKPILDFGAGDGAVSFLRAGGRLSPHYDAFSETLDTTAFFSGADIYDQFHGRSSNVVATPANYRIDVGFDLKPNLLAKASMFNFYDRTVVGDGNAPLPFDAGTFQTVFSNIVYWLDEPGRVVSELSRVTKSGGKVVLHVPSDQLAQYSFYNKYYVEAGRPLEMRFLEALDLGRLANNIKISRSEAEWRTVFDAAGLTVERARGYLSGALIRFWDVGLRPFSPFIIEMANALPMADRARIKRRWVEETSRLFEGFMAVQDELERAEPPSFFLFVLRKP